MVDQKHENFNLVFISFVKVRKPPALKQDKNLAISQSLQFNTCQILKIQDLACQILIILDLEIQHLELQDSARQTFDILYDLLLNRIQNKTQNPNFIEHFRFKNSYIDLSKIIQNVKSW